MSNYSVLTDDDITRLLVADIAISKAKQIS